MDEGGISDGIKTSIPPFSNLSHIPAEQNSEDTMQNGRQEYTKGAAVSLHPTGFEYFVAKQIVPLHRERSFVIRQEPTVGKIAGALEFPKKTFLYLLANSGQFELT
jgi:hypothetical protein